MPITAPKAEAAEKSLEFEPHCASSTNWVGVTAIGPFTLNGDPMPFPAARVLLIFHPQMHPESACIIFDSEEGADGSILISSSEAWYFEIPEQPLPVWPGLWSWELSVVDTRDVKTHLHRGQILIRP